MLSGTGTVRLGDETQRIGPGDFIGYPTNGVAHSMINDGTQALVCLVIGQRLAQDVSDYPEAGKRLYRNSGRWDLVAVDDIDPVDR